MEEKRLNPFESYRDKLKHRLKQTLYVLAITLIIVLVVAGGLIFAIGSFFYGMSLGFNRLGVEPWLSHMLSGALLFIILTFLLGFLLPKNRNTPTDSYTTFTGSLKHWIFEHPWTSVGLSAALGLGLATPWRQDKPANSSSSSTTPREEPITREESLWTSALMLGLNQFSPMLFQWLKEYVEDFSFSGKPQEHEVKESQNDSSGLDETAVPSPS